jgi:Holliday junction resolvase RusA-like endonuclease
MLLKFIVPGPVQAKERHRTSALKRCMACQRTVIGWPCRYCGGTKLEFVANVSTPGKKSETYESFVALCAREAGAAATGTGAVVLRARFYFAIPKSRARKLAEGDYHTQRPDLDNCLKSIKDGLNQVAWHDDCCVVEIHAQKLWTHGEPRAEIEVEGLDGLAGNGIVAGNANTVCPDPVAREAPLETDAVSGHPMLPLDTEKP